MSTPGIDPLWDYSDPAASEGRFRDALARGGDAQHLAELNTQLARALTLQRRYEEAAAILESIERDLESVSTRVRVRCLLERSRWLNDGGETEKSQARALLALESALPDPDLLEFAMDAAHMLGYVGDPGQAIAWNARAIALAHRSGAPAATRWLGTLWSNQGHKHLELKRFEDALDCFERALAEREKRGQVQPVRDARCDIARTYRLMGRMEEARTLQSALLAELEADGAPTGYVLEELGECALQSGEGSMAADYFARAHAQLSRDPWFPRSGSARLQRMLQLASPQTG